MRASILGTSNSPAERLRRTRRIDTAPQSLTNFRRGFMTPAEALSTRRVFIMGAVGLGGIVAATACRSAAPSFPTMPTLNGRMPCGSCAKPAGLSWRTSLIPAHEPGQPIQISGAIYREDNRKPASGVVLFVFQTDASGRYNKEVSGYRGENSPRLRAWMKTGTDGRYQFQSIKPGQYSGPIHIHAHLYAPGRPEWFIREFLFADDPLISQQERAALAAYGRFSPIVTLQRREDGVLVGRRDILMTNDPRRPWPPAA
jgi:protocatechuate 3,4-dioxygenase, beta subunit